MKVVFATDHAGFKLKEELLRYVGEELHYDVEDLGAFKEEKDDDYPDYIALAAQRVSESQGSVRAIVLGGSGQGEAITANRYKGVRATVYYGGSHDIIRLSREHNDANMLSLGARFLATEEARAVVKLWLSTSFTKDTRHVRRIAKIDLHKSA